MRLFIVVVVLLEEIEMMFGLKKCANNINLEVQDIIRVLGYYSKRRVRNDEQRDCQNKEEVQMLSQVED